ncbi:uncharacterized protein LOC123677962 [Harmonia axyridis]|uniref:uncharacterized protein LOC123677962 n=1 Tax=Harmonia axyridis TaxID=115357 RepID=UPI001E27727B|nr:uncharacterized protein LOC123677962 [Harmonia axyridis]
MDFTNRFSVTNSLDLTNKISNVNIPPNCILVSFDVSNLFPSIDPEDCLMLVRQLLFSNSDLPTCHILNLCSLVDLVLRQNFFQFNNLFYVQKSGLAMGSNLSPLLAEVFMSNLESTISQHPSFSKILFWHRYVDDILALFKGTLDDLNNFLILLNSFNPRIQFTMEVESDNKLPFLDLMIHKSDTLEFSIYRKPTNTDNIIPFHSNHPYSHKFASFHSLFNRLFTVPLNNANFLNELNIIKQIAYNNGFPIHLINRLYCRYVNKFSNHRLTQRNPQNKYFSLTYFGPISLKLKNILLKKLNTNNISEFSISFKTSNNLKHSLVNSKDKIPMLDKSGVYRLNCSNPDCRVCYIGQTGRKIKTRLSEHVRLIESNSDKDEINSNSVFSNHIINEKHNFVPNSDVEILHVCDKGKKLNLLETLEINKAIKSSEVQCINEQTNFDSLKLFNSLLF